jgi:hypothetical protein
MTRFPGSYHLLRTPLAALFGVALAAGRGATGTGREPRTVRVCAGGDVAMGTNIDPRWQPGAAALRPDSLVRAIAPLFAGADIALVNVEGAIGDGAAPAKCKANSNSCYALRQPPGTEVALRALLPSGRVVGNVANNHAHDAGMPGFAETLRRLAGAGVLATGAETLATPVPIADGDAIGVLGFSPWSVASVLDVDAVRRHVARAVSRYHRVIVTMHIGAEGPGARHVTDRAEMFAGERRGNSVAFARAATEAGASLVIGHGPHVVRGIEWAGPALVAHSLGNLLTYGPFNTRDYAGRAAVLCATIEPDGAVDGVVLRPTRIVPPGVATPDPAARALADFRELSAADFPVTGAAIGADGAVTRRR